MSGVASKIAQERARAAGLGSIKNPVKFGGQDYEKLKAEHLASGTLFEDPKFPADQSSLGVKKLGPDSEKVKGLEWKRPKEIQTNPEFIVGGAERDDVRQGKLGDCWLLSSIACLTMNKDCLHRVIPQDQSFDKDYAGIFHFLFWQYGQWMDVVVDDRLPIKGEKLFFVKSGKPNEFWSALLEKAYAKINGSYEALIGGHIVESLEDFTGGVGEMYHSSFAPPDLFQKVQKALKEKSFVGCGSSKTPDEKSIVAGHAYSITRAEEVTTKDGNEVQLIRVRNPWGHKEWQGAWSDNSSEWNNVYCEVRAELNIQADDGEVWMTLPDFLREFCRVDICNISLSKVCCGETCKWCLTEFNGNWKKGSTAGGNHTCDTFWINPQFRITVTPPDDDTSRTCPVTVSLTQKDRRKMKPEGMDYLNTGFYIYKINPSDTVPLGKEFFKHNESVGCKDNLSHHRDVSDHFDLLPGDYVILVSTIDAPEEADFYLRVFTEKPAGARDPMTNILVTPFEPIITPDTESEFDIVKDELQKGEFNEGEVKNLLDKMVTKYPEMRCDDWSAETVRLLIKLMDTDHTGTLSTEEFKRTWLKVKNYMKIFKSVDTDNTGTISVPEFRNALKEAGIPLPADIVEAVVERFVRGHELQFVELVCCLARLETVLNMFNTLDPNNSGSIKLSATEWLRAALA